MRFLILYEFYSKNYLKKIKKQRKKLNKRVKSEKNIEKLGKINPMPRHFNSMSLALVFF